MTEDRQAEAPATVPRAEAVQTEAAPAAEVQALQAEAVQAEADLQEITREVQEAAQAVAAAPQEITKEVQEAVLREIMREELLTALPRRADIKRER